jgi:hypothetical protein
VKRRSWWSPKKGSGTLLSYRRVRTYVFELPPLARKESEASLRYKVRAILPVDAAGFDVRSRFFRQGKKSYGAAFLAPMDGREALPKKAGALRIGLPLLWHRPSPASALLIVSCPEGLAMHHYERGILEASIAPIEPEDLDLRSRALARYPGAELVAIAPDAAFPLPADLIGYEAPEGLRKKLYKAFPRWEAPPRRSYAGPMGFLLLAAGLALAALALGDAQGAREERNAAWKARLEEAEALSMTPGIDARAATYLKAQGIPIPELFDRLSKAWGDEARIIDLEWSLGKLSLTAVGRSALGSIGNLRSDPWFRDIRVVEIRMRKDGSEEFTIEGGLSIDF